MNNPKTSLIVVIKGPVAKAGSILYFSRVNGISVPNIAANTTTANNEMLTVALSKIPYPRVNEDPNIMTEQIIPFRRPTKSSFNNF